LYEKEEMYAGANQGGREMEVMNGNRVLNKKAVPSFFNMEEILNENMMLGKSIQKNSHFGPKNHVGQEELEESEGLDKSYNHFRSLALASYFKDNTTGNHLIKTSRYAGYLAKKHGLPSKEIKNISIAALVHDVGKIGIPESIINKPALLNRDEIETVRTHTTIGEKILGPSDSDFIKTAKAMALTHHERWDGKGYPFGISKHDIPLEGRICAVADVFEALTSKRSYKETMSADSAIQIIDSDRGKAFDPRVVDIFRTNIDGILKIKNSFDGKEAINVLSKSIFPQGNEICFVA
jgi:HD-GYP domain-containing protein (c-di-GMP phosphodiesterase class II)